MKRASQKVLHALPTAEIDEPHALLELVETLARLCGDEDRFCVLPVYYAGGTTVRSVTSVMFVGALRARGVQAVYVRDYDTCADYLTRETRKGDVVLCMGARDPDLSELARSIVRQLASQ